MLSDHSTASSVILARRRPGWRPVARARWWLL